MKSIWHPPGLGRPTPRILPYAVIAATLGSLASTASAQIVWTGAADSNWSNSGNWNPASVPGVGDDVTFGVGIAPATDVQVGAAGQSAHSVTVETPNGLSLSGGSLTLSGGLTYDPLGAQTGGLALNSNFLLGNSTQTWTIGGGYDTPLNGTVSGSGSWTVSGIGQLVLNGSSDYAGSFGLQGYVKLGSDQIFGQLDAQGGVLNLNGQRLTAGDLGTQSTLINSQVYGPGTLAFTGNAGASSMTFLSSPDISMAPGLGVTSTISGVWQGLGTFIKEDAGTTKIAAQITANRLELRGGTLDLNNGLSLSVLNGGVLSAGTTLTDSGTFGTLILRQGTLSNEGASFTDLPSLNITPQSGETLTLDGPSAWSGLHWVTKSGPGALKFGADFSANFLSVNALGTIDANGHKVEFQGVEFPNGSGFIGAAAQFNSPPTLTDSAGGGAFVFHDSTFAASPILLNQPNITFAPAAGITAHNYTAFNGAGTFAVDGAGTFAVSAPIAASRLELRQGTLDLNNGSTLSVANGGVLSAGTTLTDSGTFGTLILRQGTLSNQGALFTDLPSLGIQPQTGETLTLGGPSAWSGVHWVTKSGIGTLAFGVDFSANFLSVNAQGTIDADGHKVEFQGVQFPSGGGFVGAAAQFNTLPTLTDSAGGGVFVFHDSVFGASPIMVGKPSITFAPAAGVAAENFAGLMGVGTLAVDGAGTFKAGAPINANRLELRQGTLDLNNVQTLAVANGGVLAAGTTLTDSGTFGTLVLRQGLVQNQGAQFTDLPSLSATPQSGETLTLGGPDAWTGVHWLNKTGLGSLSFGADFSANYLSVTAQGTIDANGHNVQFQGVQFPSGGGFVGAAAQFGTVETLADSTGGGAFVFHDSVYGASPILVGKPNITFAPAAGVIAQSFVGFNGAGTFAVDGPGTLKVSSLINADRLEVRQGTLDLNNNSGLSVANGGVLAAGTTLTDSGTFGTLNLRKGTLANQGAQFTQLPSLGVAPQTGETLTLGGPSAWSGLHWITLRNSGTVQFGADFSANYLSVLSPGTLDSAGHKVEFQGVQFPNGFGGFTGAAAGFDVAPTLADSVGGGEFVFHDSLNGQAPTITGQPNITFAPAADSVSLLGPALNGVGVFAMDGPGLLELAGDVTAQRFELRQGTINVGSQTIQAAQGVTLSSGAAFYGTDGAVTGLIKVTGGDIVDNGATGRVNFQVDTPNGATTHIRGSASFDQAAQFLKTGAGAVELSENNMTVSSAQLLGGEMDIKGHQLTVNGPLELGLGFHLDSSAAGGVIRVTQGDLVNDGAVISGKPDLYFTGSANFNFIQGASDLAGIGGLHVGSSAAGSYYTDLGVNVSADTFENIGGILYLENKTLEAAHGATFRSGSLVNGGPNVTTGGGTLRVKDGDVTWETSGFIDGAATLETAPDAGHTVRFVGSYDTSGVNIGDAALSKTGQGTLDLNGHTYYAAGLTLDGGKITDTAGGGMILHYGSKPLEVRQGEINVPLQSSSTMTKTGDGTVILSADQRGFFTGSLQIGSGKVVATVDGATGTGSTAVFGTGFLSATGFQTSYTRVMDGGTLGTGDSIGKLTIRELELDAGASLSIKLGATGDEIVAKDFFGASQTAGSITVNLQAEQGVHKGVYTVLDWGTTEEPPSLNLSAFVLGQHQVTGHFEFGPGNTSLDYVLTEVPEPWQYGAVSGLALVGFACRRRFRRC